MHKSTSTNTFTIETQTLSRRDENERTKCDTTQKEKKNGKGGGRTTINDLQKRMKCMHGSFVEFSKSLICIISHFIFIHTTLCVPSKFNKAFSVSFLLLILLSDSRLSSNYVLSSEFALITKRFAKKPHIHINICEMMKNDKLPRDSLAPKSHHSFFTYTHIQIHLAEKKKELFQPIYLTLSRVFNTLMRSMIPFNTHQQRISGRKSEKNV